MSVIMEDLGGYGSGVLGDVTDPASPYINARAIAQNLKTYKFLATPIDYSIYQTWDDCVGCQVLIHCIGAKSGSAGSLGEFLIATITATEETDDGLLVTVDKSLAPINGNENSFYWQALLIPEFRNLTLTSKSIKPDPVSFSNIPLGYGTPETGIPLGGVTVFKCSNTLTLNGGHIDLRDAGFSTGTDTTYRPNLSHENNGALDTDIHSGSENSVTKDRLLVNCGDGACLVIAKNINCASSSSRIGNPSTQGVQYCRGASDSTGTPANVSNVGGSSIFIAAYSWSTFTPAVIAKYRSGGTGRGLARAYLAIAAPGNNFLPDEGLYALDCTQNKNRPKEQFNFFGFGNGQTGSFNLSAYTPEKCWNQYAAVTAISGRVYTLSKKSLGELESTVDWTVGAMVMIHQTRKSSGSDYTDGNFKLSRIVAVGGSTVTIKHDFSFDLSTYSVQMIVVPEFSNLTLGTTYSNAPRFENGCGGILAIACSGTCNLSGGKINMEGKGTFSNAVNPLLGNYWMKRSLPLGQGNGSVLIIAKNLVMNTETRLGGTFDGSVFGGTAVKDANNARTAQGGWKGIDGTSLSDTHPNDYGTGGSGKAGGTCPTNTNATGGWHSNAPAAVSTYLWGLQGAHVLIIADTITGLSLAALSTGGSGGRNISDAEDTSLAAKRGGDGGCGYGGGGFPITSDTVSYRFGGAGGYRGGGASANTASGVQYCGGGGSGGCFVYCNNVEGQTNSNLVLF